MALGDRIAENIAKLRKREEETEERFETPEDSFDFWAERDARRFKQKRFAEEVKRGFEGPDEGSIVKAPAAWAGLAYGAAEDPGKFIGHQLAELDVLGLKDSETSRIADSIEHHPLSKAFEHYLNSKGGTEELIPVPGRQRQRVIKNQTLNDFKSWIKSMKPALPKEWEDAGLSHALGEAPNNRFEDSPYYQADPQFWHHVQERAKTDRNIKASLDSFMRGIKRVNDIRQAIYYPTTVPDEGVDVSRSMAGEESGQLRDAREQVQRFARLKQHDPGVFRGWWDDLQEGGAGMIHFAATLAGYPPGHDLPQTGGVFQAARPMGAGITSGMAGSLQATFHKDEEGDRQIWRQPLIAASVILPAAVGGARMLTSGSRMTLAAKRGVPLDEVGTPGGYAADKMSRLSLIKAIKENPDIAKFMANATNIMNAELNVFGGSKIRDTSPAGRAGLRGKGKIPGEDVVDSQLTQHQIGDTLPGELRGRTSSDVARGAAKDLAYMSWTGLPFLGLGEFFASVALPGALRYFYGGLLKSPGFLKYHENLLRYWTVAGNYSVKDALTRRKIAASTRNIAETARGKLLTEEAHNNYANQDQEGGVYPDDVGYVAVVQDADIFPGDSTVVADEASQAWVTDDTTGIGDLPREEEGAVQQATPLPGQQTGTRVIPRSDQPMSPRLAREKRRLRKLVSRLEELETRIGSDVNIRRQAAERQATVARAYPDEATVRIGHAKDLPLFGDRRARGSLEAEHERVYRITQKQRERIARIEEAEGRPLRETEEFPLEEFFGETIADPARRTELDSGLRRPKLETNELGESQWVVDPEGKPIPSVTRQQAEHINYLKRKQFVEELVDREKQRFITEEGASGENVSESLLMMEEAKNAVLDRIDPKRQDKEVTVDKDDYQAGEETPEYWQEQDQYDAKQKWRLEKTGISRAVDPEGAARGASAYADYLFEELKMFSEYGGNEGVLRLQMATLEALHLASSVARVGRAKGRSRIASNIALDGSLIIDSPLHRLSVGATAGTRTPFKIYDKGPRDKTRARPKVPTPPKDPGKKASRAAKAKYQRDKKSYEENKKSYPARLEAWRASQMVKSVEGSEGLGRPAPGELGSQTPTMKPTGESEFVYEQTGPSRRSVYDKKTGKFREMTAAQEAESLGVTFPDRVIKAATLKNALEGKKDSAGKVTKRGYLDYSPDELAKTAERFGLDISGMDTKEAATAVARESILRQKGKGGIEQPNLEKKTRKDLLEIAEAEGLELSARTKKPDIIEAILFARRDKMVPEPYKRGSALDDFDSPAQAAERQRVKRREQIARDISKLPEDEQLALLEDLGGEVDPAYGRSQELRAGGTERVDRRPRGFIKKEIKDKLKDMSLDELVTWAENNGYSLGRFEVGERVGGPKYREYRDWKQRRLDPTKKEMETVPNLKPLPRRGEKISIDPEATRQEVFDHLVEAATDRQLGKRRDVKPLEEATVEAQARSDAALGIVTKRKWDASPEKARAEGFKDKLEKKLKRADKKAQKAIDEEYASLDPDQLIPGKEVLLPDTITDIDGPTLRALKNLESYLMNEGKLYANRVKNINDMLADAGIKDARLKSFGEPERKVTKPKKEKKPKFRYKRKKVYDKRTRKMRWKSVKLKPRKTRAKKATAKKPTRIQEALSPQKQLERLQGELISLRKKDGSPSDLDTFVSKVHLSDLSLDQKRVLYRQIMKMAEKTKGKGYKYKLKKPTSDLYQTWAEEMNALMNGYVVPERLSSFGKAGSKPVEAQLRNIIEAELDVIEAGLYGDNPTMSRNEAVSRLSDIINDIRTDKDSPFTPEGEFNPFFGGRRKVDPTTKSTLRASQAARNTYSLIQRKTGEKLHPRHEAFIKQRRAELQRGLPQKTIDMMEAVLKDYGYHPDNYFKIVFDSEMAKVLEKVVVERKKIQRDNLTTKGTREFELNKVAEDVASGVKASGGTQPFRAALHQIKKMRADKNYNIFMPDRLLKDLEKKGFSPAEMFILRNETLKLRVDKDANTGFANGQVRLTKEQLNKALTQTIDGPEVVDLSLGSKSVKDAQPFRAIAQKKWTKEFLSSVQNELKRMEKFGASPTDRSAYVANLIDIMNEGHSLIQSDSMKQMIAKDAISYWNSKLQERGIKKLSRAQAKKMTKAVVEYLENYDMPFTGQAPAMPYARVDPAQAILALRSVPNNINLRLPGGGDPITWNIVDATIKTWDKQNPKMKSALVAEALTRLHGKFVRANKFRVQAYQHMAEMARMGITEGDNVKQAAAKLILNRLVDGEGMPLSLPNRLKGEDGSIVNVSPQELIKAMKDDPIFMREELGRLLIDRGEGRKLNNKDLEKLFGKRAEQYDPVEGMVHEFAEELEEYVTNKGVSKSGLNNHTKFLAEDLAEIEAFHKRGNSLDVRDLSELSETGAIKSSLDPMTAYSRTRALLGAKDDLSVTRQELLSEVMPDVHFNPEYRDAIAFEAKVSRQMEDWKAKSLSYVKGRMTVHSFLTQIGNKLSNDLAVALTTGEDLVSANYRFRVTDRLFALYKKDKKAFDQAVKKNPKLKKLAEAIESINENTNIGVMDAVSNEFDPKTGKLRGLGVAERAVNAWMDNPISRKQAEAYQWSDNSPRRAEVLREYMDFQDYFESLRDGEYIFLEVGDNAYTGYFKRDGKLYRQATKDPHKVLRKGEPSNLVLADQKILNQDIASASARKTFSRIFNFRNVPRFIKSQRGNWLGVFTPFISFPWLAIDLPTLGGSTIQRGVRGKKGILAGTILNDLFDSSMMTNSRAVQWHRTKKQVARGTRRAMLIHYLQKLNHPEASNVEEAALYQRERAEGSYPSGAVRRSPYADTVRIFRWNGANPFDVSRSAMSLIASAQAQWARTVAGLFGGKEGREKLSSNPEMRSALREWETKSTVDRAMGIATLGGGLIGGLFVELSKPGVDSHNVFMKRLPQMIFGTNEWQAVKTAIPLFSPERAKGDLSSFKHIIDSEDKILENNRRDTLEHGFSRYKPWEAKTPEEQFAFLAKWAGTALTRAWFRPHRLSPMKQNDMRKAYIRTLKSVLTKEYKEKEEQASSLQDKNYYKLMALEADRVIKLMDGDLSKFLATLSTEEANKLFPGGKSESIKKIDSIIYMNAREKHMKSRDLLFDMPALRSVVAANVQKRYQGTVKPKTK